MLGLVSAGGSTIRAATLVTAKLMRLRSNASKSRRHSVTDLCNITTRNDSAGASKAVGRISSPGAYPHLNCPLLTERLSITRRPCFFLRLMPVFLVATLTACGGDGGSRSSLSNSQPSIQNDTSTSGETGASNNTDGSDDANTDSKPDLDSDFANNRFRPQMNFAAHCANPRFGIDAYGRPCRDTQGSFEDEANWLKSWSRDRYLWYREIKDIDPHFLALARKRLRIILTR